MAKARSAKHDLLAVWAFTSTYAPIVGALALFKAKPAAWSFAVAYIVIGVRAHAIIILAHETFHRTLFRSGRVNDLLGAWLCGYPLLVRFEVAKREHFEHHRRVGRSDDPYRPRWDWPRERRAAFLQHVFLMVTGLWFVKRVVDRLRAARRPPAADVGERSGSGSGSGDQAPGPGGTREILYVAIAQGLIVALFALTLGWYWYPLLWAMPVFTVGVFLDELRNFLEHRNGEIRIFRSNAIERAILGPFNFHLHGLHHERAAEPWFRLSEIEAEVLAQNPAIKVHGTYAAELVSYLRGPREITSEPAA